LDKYGRLEKTKNKQAVRMKFELLYFRNNLLMGKIESSDARGDENLKTDEFLPKYELEYGLPDIPVKPKLFRYVDTDPNSSENTLFKYEYSSIEMI